MIHEQMKKDNMQALKDKDTVKRSVLTVVLSKLNVMAVEAHVPFMGDVETSQHISKVIKELEDEKSAFANANRNDRVEELARQIAIIKVYLPQQLSEDEIMEEIGKLEDKSIPSVMKHFKANFSGKVDMGLVNKIAKTL